MPDEVAEAKVVKVGDAFRADGKVGTDWLAGCRNHPARMQGLKIQYFLDHERLKIIGGGIAAMLVCLVMAGHVSAARLATWMALYGFVSLVRIILVRAHSRMRPSGDQIRSWGKLIAATSLLAGATWGLAAVLLFAQDSYFHQTVLALVMVTISVAATYTYAPLREAQVTFILTVLVSFAARYYFRGTTPDLVIGTVLLVFSFGLIKVADRINATIEESLVAQDERRILVESLSEQKSQAEQLNEKLVGEIKERTRAEGELRKMHQELESRVESRTTDLVRANELLEAQVRERMRTEIRLRESEERYRRLVDLAPLPISIYTDGIIVFVNSAAVEAMRAKNPDELIGRHVRDLVEPEVWEQATRRISEMFERWEPAPGIEVPVLRADGATGWAEICSAPIMYKGQPSIMVIALDVTERKQTEERLKANLKEKEVLLREIHHRVKNNLQIMSSLLALQSVYAGEGKASDVLKDAQRRICSMAVAHETLYRSGDFGSISARDYLGKLAKDLLTAIGPTEADVRLSIDIDDLPLNIDTAISCGLVVNELMANSLKHAFIGREAGEVELTFKESEVGNFVLVVRDDGIGIADPKMGPKTRSFGLDLVETLVQDLCGTIKFEIHQGTTVTLSFPDAQDRRKEKTDPGEVPQARK